MARAASSPNLRDEPSRPRGDGATPPPAGCTAETVHDLRNMLAIIISGTHVLGRHEASGELRDVIDAMQTAAQTAGQLIARLAVQSGDRDTAGSTPRKFCRSAPTDTRRRLRS
jgi:hypothetical protein